MIYINDDGLDKIGARFVLDRIQTQTPYGQQAKKLMKPYLKENQSELVEELDKVETVTALIGKHRYTFVEIRNQFKKIKDLSGSFDRIQAGEVLSVPELFEIKSLVLSMGEIENAVSSMKWVIPPDLKVSRLTSVEELLDPESQGVNTFYLYDAYSSELSLIRKSIKHIDDEVRRLQKTKRLQLEDVLGIKIRPNGEVTISKENKELIEKLSGQDALAYSAETYMNITFRMREDDSIDTLVTEKEQLIQKEDEESFRVRESLTQTLNEHLDHIQKNIRAIAALDLLIAKSYFGIGFSCVKPIISDDGHLSIVNGRHPAVEERLKRENKSYKPVSVSINEGVTCITGANMGGKTVTLKMIGNLVWLAQMGLFVPAESMTLSLRAFIFVSIGDEQDVDLGLSTFGAEIIKISQAVEVSKHRGLILIDELARGTNPKEGYAISKALINRLKKNNSMTLITTHFDGLADAEDVTHLQVCGLQNVDFEKLKNEISTDVNNASIGLDLLHEYMDYRLKEIHSPEEVPKDAVRIAHLMGLNSEILDDAKIILSEFGRGDAE